MDERRFAQVKALVEQWDEDWGCGPWEECLPEPESLRELNRLTGRDWTAEEVRALCFEYTSHNSLEETVYYLFRGEYPPVNHVELVFYRPKPGAVLEPKAVYEKYRLGNRMKALEPLPRAPITAALQALPGFQEHAWNGSEPEGLRMDGLDQPEPWSDVHFWAFWYGGRGNPQPDHLLCLACRSLTEEQTRALMDLLSGFGIPLQYREEDRDGE